MSLLLTQSGLCFSFQRSIPECSMVSLSWHILAIPSTCQVTESPQELQHSSILPGGHILLYTSFAFSLLLLLLVSPLLLFLFCLYSQLYFQQINQTQQCLQLWIKVLEKSTYSLASFGLRILCRQHFSHLPIPAKHWTQEGWKHWLWCHENKFTEVICDRKLLWNIFNQCHSSGSTSQILEKPFNEKVERFFSFIFKTN